MKINKINENKVSIVLTLEELAEHNITIKDIESNKNKAQNFLFEILEESELNLEFIDEGSQLLVEASTDTNNLFIITISKISSIGDVTKQYSSLNSFNLISYSVSSNIYMFKDYENLKDFSFRAKIEKLYLGCNSLYNYNGKYFLVFSSSTIKKVDFTRTFCLLSEFTDKYYSKSIYKSAILEYAFPLIEREALQIIQNSNYTISF